MPRVALTEEQVARILAAPKTVNDDIRWRSKGNAMWAGCTVPVINELKQTLQLNANANLVDRTKYSFSLIASNSYRVAGFDANGSHRNIHRNTEKWLARSHKHRWTEICRDTFAYNPSDIDETNIEAAFRAFCTEIGVEFNGTVEALPIIQTTMEF